MCKPAVRIVARELVAAWAALNERSIAVVPARATLPAIDRLIARLADALEEE